MGFIRKQINRKMCNTFKENRREDVSVTAGGKRSKADALPGIVLVKRKV